MKIRTSIKIASLVGLALVVSAPASAGPYRGEVNVVRGARMEGVVQIAANSFAEVALEIRQLQGVSADGLFSVFPSPPTPTVSQEPPRNAGCITFDAGPLGRDHGCVDDLTPVTVSIDPAMLTGQVVLRYDSTRFEGDYIDVTLLLQGSGQITPAVEGDGPPAVDDEPKVTFFNEILLLRDVTVQAGSIRSRGLGRQGIGLGGAVVSTERAQMFTGVQGVLDFSADCLVSLSQQCLAP